MGNEGAKRCVQELRAIHHSESVHINSVAADPSGMAQTAFQGHPGIQYLGLNKYRLKYGLFVKPEETGLWMC